MKKSFFWLCVLFIILTTYKPKFDLFRDFSLNIKKIIIENNSILEAGEIKNKLIFLYDENLFFLNTGVLEKKLKTIDFIESFSVKKIYPKTLKLIIKEKKPVAILHKKKEKFYITDKGELISFRNVEIYKGLPTVFGKGNVFPALFRNLRNIEFPIETIKSIYFFESGRWDLIMFDDKVIKLPNSDYILSLENFMNAKNNNNLKKYKIFDYRIKNQLILK